MNKNVILILLLLIFNCFFLYQNSRLSEKIKKYEKESGLDSEVLRTQDFLSTTTIEKSSLPAFKRGIKLATFIYKISCSSCIAEEISLLNKYYKMFDGRLKVYWIADSSTALEQLGAHFPYTTISNTSEILGKKIPPRNPFSIVYDDNFIFEVRQVNIEQPFSTELSSLFYNKQMDFLKMTNSI